MIVRKKYYKYEMIIRKQYYKYEMINRKQYYKYEMIIGKQYEFCHGFQPPVKVVNILTNKTTNVIQFDINSRKLVRTRGSQRYYTEALSTHITATVYVDNSAGDQKDTSVLKYR